MTLLWQLQNECKYDHQFFYEPCTLTVFPWLEGISHSHRAVGWASPPRPAGTLLSHEHGTEPLQCYTPETQIPPPSCWPTSMVMAAPVQIAVSPFPRQHLHVHTHVHVHVHTCKHKVGVNISTTCKCIYLPKWRIPHFTVQEYILYTAGNFGTV